MAFPRPNTSETRSSMLGSRFVTFQFTAGAAGAAPAAMTQGGGYLNAVPITKSTNDYIFNLTGTWFRLANWYGNVRQASFATTGAADVNITVDATATVAAPTFTLSFYRRDTGAAVALAAGDIVWLTVEVSNEKD